MSEMYLPARQQTLNGNLNFLTIDIRVVLIDTADYTFSNAHDFLDDVAAAARVAEVTLPTAGRTITNGVFDGADVTMTSVTGDVSEALLLYQFVTNDADSRLLVWIDSATGLPITPNGGDIDIVWDSGANKIFAL